MRYSRARLLTGGKGCFGGVHEKRVAEAPNLKLVQRHTKGVDSRTLL